MGSFLYQLEHDKSLVSPNGFLYKEKNEIINGISLWLRFDNVFEATEGDTEFDQTITVEGKTWSLNATVCVRYDQPTKTFSFIPNDKLNIGYTVVGYSKDVVETVESDIAKELRKLTGYNVPFAESVMIKKEEFEFLLENYGQLFPSDNCLQSCAYCTHRLEYS